MFKTSIILMSCLFFWVALSFGQQKSIDRQIGSLVGFLNAKDTAGLLAMMADSCRIGNLPPTNNKVALPQILPKINQIADYKIVSVSVSLSGNRLVSVQVTYEKGNKGRPTFLFNAAGKLINLGIIRARTRANPEKSLDSAISNALRIDTLRMPFRLINGLIYVSSQLNGQKGFFMFDSGAPVIILNRKYVSAKHINPNISVDFTGMGGKMNDVHWSTGNQVEWNRYILSRLDAPVAPMPDMTIDDKPVFGLMGYGILKGYQITFDYGKKEILLERVNEDGRLLGVSFDKGKIIDSAPLAMKRHIPIVKLQFGGKAFPMGIDCGANANLLSQEAATELAPFIAYEKQTVNIEGIGKNTQNSQIAYLKNAKLGIISLGNMFTVFTDQPIGGGSGDDKLPIIGLLGMPFLEQYRITLNFNLRQLMIYR